MNQSLENINLKNANIYFLGIGGIGMSGLARYFLQQGCKVYGYDLTRTALTDYLSDLGAEIHYDENISKIPQNIDFVVYTPAIPKEHKEYQYFLEHDFLMCKRSVVLGFVSAKLPTIAIAGTHGKTTTTAMTATVMDEVYQQLAFIGGVAKNFNANVVIEDDAELMVVEADEFDRSFLTLYPKVAVITSMDADHLDIYGKKEQLELSFQQFAHQVQNCVVVNEKIADDINHQNKKTYGLQEDCDYYATDIALHPNSADFILNYEDGKIHVHLSVSGNYNVLNAVAAFASCREFCETMSLPFDARQMAARLSLFNGVKRRFDYRIERPDFVYIDDYAHHPEELRSFLSAVRNIYPDKKICGIFQPHLYTRTRDFAPQFAEVLSMLDEVILLNIYPARELPIPGIDSQFLLDQINCKKKILLPDNQVVDYLNTHRPEVLLTMGAGNIDRLVPQIEKNFRIN